MNFVLVFLISFGISAIITPLIKGFALKYGFVDKPGEDRKIHKKPMPLLGGVGIYISLVFVIAVLWFATDWISIGAIEAKHLIGVLVGLSFLLIGGVLDDKINLRPRYQIIWPILSALSLIMAGIGIDQITNPLGGTIVLNQWEIILFWWQGLAYKLTMPSDIFTFVWVLGMIYTTKFLDGLDGLSAGITGIGAFMIFFLALYTQFFQPDVGMLAIIVAGAIAGFLIYNFYPAKIFLGESGSTMLGFLLGTLAIISGGKIATALLVMGIPVLDVLWVILRRVFIEKKSPFKGDRKHLHFRMLDLGLNQRQAVLFLYLIAALFGTATLFLQSQYKLLTLGVLALVMVVMATILVKSYKEES